MDEFLSCLLEFDLSSRGCVLIVSGVENFDLCGGDIFDQALDSLGVLLGLAVFFVGQICLDLSQLGLSLGLLQLIASSIDDGLLCVGHTLIQYGELLGVAGCAKGVLTACLRELLLSIGDGLGSFSLEV